eukprot:525177-Rhodomonas_salina.1
MRWSIGKEESDSMDTSAICMRELENCQFKSAGINYLWIPCDKYGFRPPPKTIPQAVFELLLTAMGPEEQAFVKECYKLDTNSTTTPEHFKPPLPVCGPPRKVREEWDQLDGPQYVLQISTKPWEPFAQLVAILRTAAITVWDGEDARDPKSSHWLKKFIISVTEEEQSNGILWAIPEGGRTRIKVSLRKFEGGVPATDPVAGKFIDLNGGKVDEEAQELLRQQKGMTTPDRTWTVPWAPGKGIDATKAEHKEYLTNFCTWYTKVCVESLEEALANEVVPDTVVEEARRHLEFAQARAAKFHDTPTAMRVLERVRAYMLAGYSGKASVVWGKSGAGKTYIMSKAVWEAAERSTASNGVCIVRFLGTSADSSKVALLLESVVRQLVRAYDKDDVEIPSDFRELAELFKTAVTTWPTPDKPLTLVLDSVDQLDDTNGGRALLWLP